MATNSSVKTKPIEQIVIDETSKYFGIEPIDLKNNKSKTTNDEEAYRRHICFYLLRENTFISLQGVADLFQTKPTTVHSGIKIINSRRNMCGIYRRINVDITSIQKLIDNFKQELQNSWLTPSNN